MLKLDSALQLHCPVFDPAAVGSAGLRNAAVVSAAVVSGAVAKCWLLW